MSARRDPPTGHYLRVAPMTESTGLVSEHLSPVKSALTGISTRLQEMLISPESGQFDRGPWATPNHRTVTGVISVISGTFHRTPDSTPVKIPGFSIYLCGPQ